ncbi:MAG: hypothetical protein AAGA81_00070 [Acidobacteriota bacterium]
MTALTALREDLAVVSGEIDEAEWDRVRAQTTEASYSSKETIFGQMEVANQILFVSSGITASEQVYEDGSSGIARFFETGHLCANLTSLWHRQIAEDELFAVTNVTGVLIPMAMFEREYLHGDAFGRYLRRKVMDTLLFDKSVLVAKTLTTSEARYRFLEEQYAQVIPDAPANLVARFLGMTPQGLSRFLRNRHRT